MGRPVAAQDDLDVGEAIQPHQLWVCHQEAVDRLRHDRVHAIVQGLGLVDNREQGWVRDGEV